MEDIEKTNTVKVLEELQKNARATLSELAKKTGLTRQTIAKTIINLEKNKQIWGYTTIFDPILLDKKPFILLGKIDLSIKPEEFLKKVTNEKLINENEEKLGLKISMYLHGSSDFLGLFWAKDIIEARKVMNFYKKVTEPNMKEIELFDVMATFRSCGITNPKMIEEWTNLLI